MIAIIDYGVGNLFSLRSSLAHLGLQAVVTGNPAQLAEADRIILPGVGAFADAMQKLETAGLVSVLKEQAAQKPLLGICLGMQLLFDKSFEYGEHAGLGLIAGDVCPLAPRLARATQPGRPPLKTPHIGWNALNILHNDPLFSNFHNGEYVYYVHSYAACHCEASTLATSDYGVPVTGVVKNGLVYGTQFHPEKSGDAGLRLLKAFAAL